MLRLGEAVAGEAGEPGSLLAAGVAGNRDLAAVGEPGAADVDAAGKLLLHDRDQPDQAAQPPVVLRLLGQVRKPARQQPPDQTEELTIGADPDRSLSNSERDQLRIPDKRRPAAASRDPILVSEDVGCNNKGFQIGHLELLSRADTWSGSPSSSNPRSLRNPTDFHIKPLVQVHVDQERGEPAE